MRKNESDEVRILEAHDLLSKLYQFLNLTNNNDFKEVVRQEIEQYNERLDKLCTGCIEGHVGEIFVYLSEFVSHATSQIVAVHVIEKLEDINAWDHFPVKAYHQSILQAVERQVPVKRIFILYSNETTGLVREYLQPEIRELLLRQQKDGIQVKVMLKEEIDDRSYIQNWIVIDDKVVEHSSCASDYSGKYWTDRRTKLTMNQREVNEYTGRFQNLERSARGLDDWLSDLDFYKTAPLVVSPYMN